MPIDNPTCRGCNLGCIEVSTLGLTRSYFWPVICRHRNAASDISNISNQSPRTTGRSVSSCQKPIPIPVRHPLACSIPFMGAWIRPQNKKATQQLQIKSFSSNTEISRRRRIKPFRLEVWLWLGSRCAPFRGVGNDISSHKTLILRYTSKLGLLRPRPLKTYRPAGQSS